LGLLENLKAGAVGERLRAQGIGGRRKKKRRAFIKNQFIDSRRGTKGGLFANPNGRVKNKRGENSTQGIHGKAGEMSD